MMSLFFPYSPTVVLSYFSDKFVIDLSSLSTYEGLLITILANIYFYVYWFFIIYICLKILNRLYERLF